VTSAVKTALAQAHSNIALIKYWGKRDEALKLPQNGSISLTLDALWTRTRVTYSESTGPDQLWLNGQLASEPMRLKVQRLLDLLRHQAAGSSGTPLGAAKIESENNFPTGAGLASSASGFAALALAATAAAGLERSRPELSKLARQGSGSACRSLYGGFAEWQRGVAADGADSYAIPLVEKPDWDLCMAVLVLNDLPKALSSGDGMALTVKTSPLYPAWLASIDEDLAQMRQAIASRNFSALGELMEHNALKMHATALASRPAVIYWMPLTLELLARIRALRQSGLECYATIDAGPNLKVLMQERDWPRFQAALADWHELKALIPCRPGPGAFLVPAA
jgi:diphosphomevalonate decarboxylase